SAQGGAGTAPAASRAGAAGGSAGVPPGGAGGDGGVTARAGGGGGGTGGSEDRLLNCSVVVDVRGLGNFQRAQSSFVFGPGNQQLWPDATLIQGVSSQLVQEGNLQTYITSEGQIGEFKNVTRVKAQAVQATRFAPTSNYITDAVLSAAAAAQFRSAGQACRVVYLKD
ncbi:hypothetical protein, partial [Deinococcus marmoris]|uniref:hypothetical protein n=1 Tax=Deinococcus marmoris TaxID=249408 RepID=UPI0039EE2A4A